MPTGTLPGTWLRDVITVEPYQGIGAAGPTFGAAVSLRAHVQESDDLPRSSAASSMIAPAVNTQRTFRVWLRLGPTVTPGSRVTIRGVATTATKVDVNIGVGAGEPSHLELLCMHATLLATTTVTITRGTPSQDAFGDLVDSPTVVAAAVQAAIAEDSQTRNAPADERGGLIETYTIRLPFGSVVYEGDRITDDHTSRKYQVTDVAYANPAVGPALGSDDVIVTARRIAGTSAPNT